MRSLDQCRRSWTAFWFAEEDGKKLAIVRILFGITFLMQVTGLWHLTLLYKEVEVGFPLHYFGSPSAYRLPTIRLPYPGFGWLPLPSYELYLTLETVTLWLGIAFVLGAGTRFVGPILSLLYAYLFLLSQISFRHHLLLLVIVMLVLGFSRCAEHYSVDAVVRRYRGQAARRVLLMPRRMLQVLVTVLYVFAGLSKLNAGWMSGRILEVVMGPAREQSYLAPLLQHTEWYPLMGRLLVTTMLLLPLGLWFRRTRWLAIAAGVVMHLGIDMTIDVETFSYQMFALYAAFL